VPEPIDAQELAILNPTANQSYGTWPLPCERDQQIRRLVDRLSDPQNSTSLAAGLSANTALTLYTFAERMASLAVRERSQQHILRGLIAASWAAARTTDVREVLLILPLLWRSMELLGIDRGSNLPRSTTGSTSTGANSSRPLLVEHLKTGASR
jgi:hypothetical protein